MTRARSTNRESTVHGTALLLAIAAVGCGTAPATSRPIEENAAEKASGSAAPAKPVSKSPAKTRPDGTLPEFRMVGKEAGFDFERYDDIRKLHRILEANGGGVGLLDIDNDGWTDIFMTNGCRLPLKDDDRRTRCELFHNQGSMKFQNQTQNSGLVQHGYTHGCTVGDFDNDGFDDLYVTAYGHNAMWHNNGDGTFVDVTDVTGTDVKHWSSSAAFADVNGDSFLDLYVVNYLEESDESPKLCRRPDSPDGLEQCPPVMFEGVDDVLFLSDGAGRFVDVTAFAGIANRKGKGLGVVVSDLDQDGRPEIFVANDGQANFLFVPTSQAPVEFGSPITGFRYEERALVSNVALSEAGYAQANMGIAAGDYDASGTTDLFITHFYADTSTLYTNRGGLMFEDATRSSKLGPPSRSRLGWGAAFCDVDSNGWLDLIVANGHVDDRTWMRHEEPWKMRAQVFRNEGAGSFSDVSDWAGDYFQQDWLGRGLAIGDLDRDGKPDGVFSNQLGPSQITRNTTATGNQSVVISLVGTACCRCGYGVRIEVLDTIPRVFRELVGGGSFQSSSAKEIHLGLGAASRATLRVTWPSGTVQTLEDVSAGSWILIEGGKRFSRHLGDL